MSKKIPLSFKETEDDMKLYLKVVESNNKSAFIKTALQFYLKYRYLEPYLQQLEEKNRIETIKKQPPVE